MAQSNLDKGQKFSGQGNSANPDKPRTLRPGGTEDSEEAVQLDWINQPGDAKELLGSRQSDTTSFSDSRKVGTGDKPFDWPRDDTKNSTAPLLSTDTRYEWGRTAPALAKRTFESYMTNPGRTGPLDPTDTNPKRPDFGAPSNAAYDVRGMGEAEINIETGIGIGGSGERGIMPDPNKKNQWA